MMLFAKMKMQYFLSSILDILLRKKDRENNSSHDHAKQLIGEF